MKQLTPGKLKALNAVAGRDGIIAAAAMDQRRTLRQSIAKAKGSVVTDAELSEFKTIVTEELASYASAILLDPEYGLEAVKAVQQRSSNTSAISELSGAARVKDKGEKEVHSVGILLAYEKTGYDPQDPGRQPELLEEWSVRRLAEVGANAIKLLVYYDPDEADQQVNLMKQKFVKNVGDECRACDIPFFLEVVAYSNTIHDDITFAAAKPAKVKQYMKEFSQSDYGVDVLKVEAPVNMRYVEGFQANKDQPVVYNLQEALDCFRDAAEATQLPFIYLSAGVSNKVFLDTLELAIKAGVPFSGVLCGRATWQDGIQAYTQGGEIALRSWLNDQGVSNIQELNKVLRKGAKPWWERE